jgi:uncharacterized membrane protein
MLQLIAPAFTVLLFAMGYLMSKAKRNFFIGIRTPWTLASEKCWDKTHKHGGLLFKIAAILPLGGIFWPYYTIVFIIVPMVLLMVYIVVYSYVVREKSLPLSKTR